jgi:hypothetical protein
MGGHGWTLPLAKSAILLVGETSFNDSIQKGTQSNAPDAKGAIIVYSAQALTQYHEVIRPQGIDTDKGLQRTNNEYRSQC